MTSKSSSITRQEGNSYTYTPEFEDSRFLKKDNKKTYTFRRSDRQKDEDDFKFDKEFQEKALRSIYVDGKYTGKTGAIAFNTKELEKAHVQLKEYEKFVLTGK